MGFVSRVVVSALFAGSLAAFIAAPASAQLPCGGILNPCPQPPPTPPQPPPPSSAGAKAFNIQAKPTDVVFGDPVEITGTFATSNYQIGERIHLVASPWPYATEQVVATGLTTRAGFSFTHAPALNTRYRVVSDPAGHVSNAVQILAFAHLRRFSVKVRRPRHVKMRLEVEFPPEFTFPLAGQKVNWYILRGRKAIQIGSSRTKADGDTLMKAKERARLPRGRYKFKAGFCVDEPLNVDTGLGEPVQDPCP